MDDKYSTVSSKCHLIEMLARFRDGDGLSDAPSSVELLPLIENLRFSFRSDVAAIVLAFICGASVTALGYTTDPPPLHVDDTVDPCIERLSVSTSEDIAARVADLLILLSPAAAVEVIRDEAGEN